MATTPASFTTSIRGIAASFTNGSIESCNVTKNVIAEQVPDQYGAIACEMVYDHRYDLTLTMHAAGSTAPTADGDTVSFDSHNWHVDSCVFGGTYNGVTRWTINAHRFDNSPAQGG